MKKKCQFFYDLTFKTDINCCKTVYKNSTLEVRIINPTEFSKLYLHERLEPKRKLYTTFRCNPFSGFGGSETNESVSVIWLLYNRNINHIDSADKEKHDVTNLEVSVLCTVV